MSKVRYLGELGQNLQKIAKMLMTQQDLLRYLYYTNENPLDPTLADVTMQDVFGSHILITPVVEVPDKDHSIISILVSNGTRLSENSEYMDIEIHIEVFVPLTQWILKSDSLRPFLILGQVMRALENKTINGLGRVSARGFSANFFTETISAYKIVFSITQYD